MKKINIVSIAAFFSITTLITSFASGLTYLILAKGLNLDSSHELSYVTSYLIVFYMMTIISFRMWINIFKTPIGTTDEKNLWHVHTYQLFYLMFFNPILKPYFLPVPMMRLFYLALGAKMGDNSYTGGIIYDAHLVTVGDNCILGDKTLLTPHQIEGETLGYYPILIGNNVTVGAHAVILPGVIIEDEAVVASGSVVPKGSHILKGEIWGGVPARRLKSKYETKPSADNSSAVISTVISSSNKHTRELR